MRPISPRTALDNEDVQLNLGPGYMFTWIVPRIHLPPRRRHSGEDFKIRSKRPPRGSKRRLLQRFYMDRSSGRLTRPGRKPNGSKWRASFPLGARSVSRSAGSINKGHDCLLINYQGGSLCRARWLPFLPSCILSRPYFFGHF